MLLIPKQGVPGVYLVEPFYCIALLITASFLKLFSLGGFRIGLCWWRWWFSSFFSSFFFITFFFSLQFLLSCLLELLFSHSLRRALQLLFGPSNSSWSTRNSFTCILSVTYILMTLSFQLRLLPQASDFYFPLLTFLGLP